MSAPALHEIPTVKVFNDAGDYLIVNDLPADLEAIAKKGYKKRGKKPKRDSSEVLERERDLT